MNLIEIPFGLPGKIYRSPMPLAAFDEGQTTLHEYDQAGIDTVVMLTASGEDLFHAGVDLNARYTETGLAVIHFPIQDFATPENLSALDQTLQQVLAAARSGRKIAIHCYAGRGRTGLFIALLARRILGLGGEEAVAWVRQYFPAIETQAQIEMVLNDLPS